MILPRIKQYKETTDTIVFPCNIRLALPSVHAARALKLATLFFPACHFSLAENNAHITAVIVPKKKHAEEYRLLVEKNGIYIEYADYLGLRNALATLSMAATVTEDGLCLPCLDSYDFPVSDHRGIMLDLARGIKPLDVLTADMILIAKSKMNILHFHLADNRGMSVRLEWLPEEYLLENCYSKDDMKRVVELAEILGLEIIPEFDLPAHSNKLITCFENFACNGVDPDGEAKWAVCAGTEAVYEFYDRIIRELADLFPGRYFHVGGDELEHRNSPALGHLCHWEYCSKCRKKMEEEGLLDRQELFYYLMNRVYESVKKAGRTMVMWGDQVDSNYPVSIPTDVILQYWKIRVKGKTPEEKPTLKTQLKMGYRAINSAVPDTYVDLPAYMNQQSLSDWRWDTRPEIDAENAHQILGSEICAWEYGNPRYAHYDQSLAPEIVTAGDKQWNGDVLPIDEAYERALTGAVLGRGGSEINLFACVGGIFPPRTEESAHWETLTCTKDEVEKTLAQLEGFKPLDFGQEFRLNTYKAMLKKTLAEWDEKKTDAKKA